MPHISPVKESGGPCFDEWSKVQEAYPNIDLVRVLEYFLRDRRFPPAQWSQIIKCIVRDIGGIRDSPFCPNRHRRLVERVLLQLTTEKLQADPFRKSLQVAQFFMDCLETMVQTCLQDALEHHQGLGGTRITRKNYLSDITLEDRNSFSAHQIVSMREKSYRPTRRSKKKPQSRALKKARWYTLEIFVMFDITPLMEPACAMTDHFVSMLVIDHAIAGKETICRGLPQYNLEECSTSGNVSSCLLSSASSLTLVPTTQINMSPTLHDASDESSRSSFSHFFRNTCGAMPVPSNISYALVTSRRVTVDHKALNIADAMLSCKSSVQFVCTAEDLTKLVHQITSRNADSSFVIHRAHSTLYLHQSQTPISGLHSVVDTFENALKNKISFGDIFQSNVSASDSAEKASSFAYDKSLYQTSVHAEMTSSCEFNDAVLWTMPELRLLVSAPPCFLNGNGQRFLRKIYNERHSLPYTELWLECNLCRATGVAVTLWNYAGTTTEKILSAKELSEQSDKSYNISQMQQNVERLLLWLKRTCVQDVAYKLAYDSSEKSRRLVLFGLAHEGQHETKSGLQENIVNMCCLTEVILIHTAARLASIEQALTRTFEVNVEALISELEGLLNATVRLQKSAPHVIRIRLTRMEAQIHLLLSILEIEIFEKSTRSIESPYTSKTDSKIRPQEIVLKSENSHEKKSPFLVALLHLSDTCATLESFFQYCIQEIRSSISCQHTTGANLGSQEEFCLEALYTCQGVLQHCILQHCKLFLSTTTKDMELSTFVLDMARKARRCIERYAKISRSAFISILKFNQVLTDAILCIVRIRSESKDISVHFQSCLSFLSEGQQIIDTVLHTESIQILSAEHSKIICDLHTCVYASAATFYTRRHRFTKARETLTTALQIPTLDKDFLLILLSWVHGYAALHSTRQDEYLQHLNLAVRCEPPHPFLVLIYCAEHNKLTLADNEMESTLQALLKGITSLDLIERWISHRNPGQSIAHRNTVRLHSSSKKNSEKADFCGAQIHVLRDLWKKLYTTHRIGDKNSVSHSCCLPMFLNACGCSSIREWFLSLDPEDSFSSYTENRCTPCRWWQRPSLTSHTSELREDSIGATLILNLNILRANATHERVHLRGNLHAQIARLFCEKLYNSHLSENFDSVSYLRASTQIHLQHAVHCAKTEDIQTLLLDISLTRFAFLHMGASDRASKINESREELRMIVAHLLRQTESVGKWHFLARLRNVIWQCTELNRIRQARRIQDQDTILPPTVAFPISAFLCDTNGFSNLTMHQDEEAWLLYVQQELATEMNDHLLQSFARRL